MLAVTDYISVDVAATPLSWVVPLGLYSVSFTVLAPLIFSPLARRQDWR